MTKRPKQEPHAVLSVLSNFNTAQWQATFNIGRIAGFEVLVYEDFLSSSPETLVAVWDLGAGTLDNAVASVTTAAMGALAVDSINVGAASSLHSNPPRPVTGPQRHSSPCGWTRTRANQARHIGLGAGLHRID
ncbi:hypothetical protein M427DRAFT_31500 [Gonapodya prolifera JEL478]|uniref:Uncharacterized protein n=1 Tax=Gonapodya prolifera (strain JEL478) TaxID=1344416 RepID=A0A139AHY3_GONPJ|nr:hypothetical protein M427DRAFT_31500 [Gonapodya prolifera JEL478]|eukprot:KXS16370.1 hypothetical protein M427DRAFT_31500 [Gonapodya prolifera JEL478]